MFLVCILVRCALLCLIFWMQIWMFHAHFIHACGFSSVFGSLKGSCRAEREEKITGADIICFCHVGLASWLTQCGPVRHGCQVDVPAHILRHNACTYPTHWPTPIHTRGCAGVIPAQPRACRACRASYVDTEKEITHLRVLTPTLNEHSFLLAKREHTETGLAGFTYSRPALFQGRRLMDCLKQEYRTKDFTSCRPDYALCVFSGVHHRVCICAAVHAFLALCRC